MIDPIQNLPLDRLQAQRPKLEQSSARKSPERPAPAAFEARRTDQAAVSFDLKGNLDSLRDSTETVFREVREQLERTYAVRNPLSETPGEGDEGLVPSEDASAQELLDFFSPANTAQRIVEFSTSFVDSFLANREAEGDATEEQLDEFSALLTGAVEEGFRQAEGILGDFEELGDVGQNIERTFDLVMQGIREFREQYFEEDVPPEEQQQAPAETPQLDSGQISSELEEPVE